MIQFNLLPDVKVDYMKARTAKHMVGVVSALAVGLSAGLLILMFSVTLAQKRHITALDKDIAAYEQEMKNTPDLAKILTIQNQLNSLPALYASRPVTSRVFNYIQQTTPVDVSIKNLTLDFSTGTFLIDGTTESLASVNRYIDTLKFTTYTVKDAPGELKAFSEVVLSSFTRDSSSAAYTISFKFDPGIFDANNAVKLKVPKTITTRSQTEKPDAGVFDSITEGNTTP